MSIFGHQFLVQPILEGCFWILLFSSFIFRRTVKHLISTNEYRNISIKGVNADKTSDLMLVWSVLSLMVLYGTLILGKDVLQEIQLLIGAGIIARLSLKYINPWENNKTGFADDAIE